MNSIPQSLWADVTLQEVQRIRKAHLIELSGGVIHVTKNHLEMVSFRQGTIFISVSVSELIQNEKFLMFHEPFYVIYVKTQLLSLTFFEKFSCISNFNGRVT